MQRFTSLARVARPALQAHLARPAPQVLRSGASLRFYAASAGLSKEQIQERVLEVLKTFEKVDPAKVRRTVCRVVSRVTCRRRCRTAPASPPIWAWTAWMPSRSSWPSKRVCRRRRWSERLSGSQNLLSKSRTKTQTESRPSDRPSITCPRYACLLRLCLRPTKFDRHRKVGWEGPFSCVLIDAFFGVHSALMHAMLQWHLVLTSPPHDRALASGMIVSIAGDL
jgi:hypothetical protein